MTVIAIPPTHGQLPAEIHLPFDVPLEVSGSPIYQTRTPVASTRTRQFLGALSNHIG
jgi:hypothetical protein